MNLQDKKLYLITDESISFDLLKYKVEEALKSGVRLLQYRRKNASTRELCNEALELKSICQRYECIFLINDRIDVALAIDADGVHLGQDDMDIEIAKRLLKDNKIIGITAKTIEQATEAESKGASYIGVGALNKSPTKTNAKQITVDELKNIRNSVKIPMFGIGGITKDNLTKDIIENVTGVCAISAVLEKNDIKKAVNEIVDCFNR
ncbi:MAG: thiamine phosphate synthase [Clostridium sp.]|uniref:thiamine phosphate synthase n=1 Tax=Clostridium sp. TaxID=1506 RepID=UPI00304923F1